MGSCLSSLVSNILVNELEINVVEKLIQEGHIISWLRYADDCLAIVQKGTVETILAKINGWDRKLDFTTELMTETLTFLDVEIFIRNSKLEFRPYKKDGLETVISNYNLSLISRKYLINNIFTALHREKYCSSSDEIFQENLPILRQIFLRNGYPPDLLDTKFEQFFKDDQKPVHPPDTYTFCIDYTSRAVEKPARKLAQMMQTLLPDFSINVAYRSKKLSNLISSSLKHSISPFEQNNVIYKWQCPCSESSYIGMTSRLLKQRVQEHQWDSVDSPILLHREVCPEYQKGLRKFRKELRQKGNPPAPKKEKFDFFLRQFTTLKKNFRSYFDRRDNEAYFIRTQRPDLNGQNEHRFFTLF